MGSFLVRTINTKILRIFWLGSIIHYLVLNNLAKSNVSVLSQPAITCSKLTIETLEQGVKFVQSCCSVSIVNFEQVNAGWDLAQLLFVLREKLVWIWPWFLIIYTAICFLMEAIVPFLPQAKDWFSDVLYPHGSWHKLSLSLLT